MGGTKSMSGTSTSKHKTIFVGKLQPITSRAPVVPMVNYAKGGDDFRTPHNLSSFGRQLTSSKHCDTGARVMFGNDSRFLPAETVGVGPGALGQQTSMRRQQLSNRRSAESTSFGTSTRDGALKLYATYTCKK